MEENGKDYHFMSVDHFFKLRDEGLLVEWEEVYPGQYYGTLFSELTKIWEGGNIVLFDVDVIGAIELKKKFKNHSLSIFIKTPTIEILSERLRKRSTETAESLQKRLLKAELEISYAPSFDTVIINDSLIDAQKQITDIVNQFLTQLNITWKHVATNH
jgi:guanylate kinase